MEQNSDFIISENYYTVKGIIAEENAGPPIELIIVAVFFAGCLIFCLICFLNKRGSSGQAQDP